MKAALPRMNSPRSLPTRPFGKSLRARGSAASPNRIAAIRNCLTDGSPLVYFGYGYDAGGRITQVLRDGCWAVYYSYDDADRLTGEVWRAADNSQIYGFWWGYDAVGIPPRPHNCCKF